MAEQMFSTMCPKCRERTVGLATVPYTDRVHYDGLEFDVTIPDLLVPKCAKCGRISFNREANLQLDAAFRKHVGILAPEEIQKHRTALGISQEQLAEAIGVPVDMLCRWEEGGQFQQRSHDNFLRAFFKAPELRAGEQADA